MSCARSRETTNAPRVVRSPCPLAPGVSRLSFPSLNPRRRSLTTSTTSTLSYILDTLHTHHLNPAPYPASQQSKTPSPQTMFSQSLKASRSALRVSPIFPSFAHLCPGDTIYPPRLTIFKTNPLAARRLGQELAETTGQGSFDPRVPVGTVVKLCECGGSCGKT